MKFGWIHFFGCVVGLTFSQLSLHASELKVELTGPKDLVLGAEKRETVLEVGTNYLKDDSGDYMAEVTSLRTPFAFKVTPPPDLTTNENNEDVVVDETPADVVYDDASVLAVSAASFASKVRGSIARGNVSYLQLEGGSMLKPGTSFPIRIPEAKNKTFMLTITEINPEGYTLQIGEATQQMSFNEKPKSNSIKITNP